MIGKGRNTVSNTSKYIFMIISVFTLTFTQNSYASWESQVINDPMDGKTISVYSRFPEITAMGNQRIPLPGAIIFTCKDKKTELTVTTQVGISITVPVSIKIDKSKTETFKWNYIKDATSRQIGATGTITYPKNPVTFALKMAKGKKLLIRISLPQFGKQLLQFDLSDFSKAIAPLRKECNW